ncbi:hypothetical protein [Nostoc sp.]|uniref:hypothetical protein n=1 Tax=Nostoc sp. TaxID=1180 RepID=UPI002FF628DB
MTAGSEGKYIFQYAQSNTGYYCTDRICIPNLNKILDNLANLGSGALGIGHWALGIGHWALGIGHWAFSLSPSSSPAPPVLSSPTPYSLLP